MFIPSSHTGDLLCVLEGRTRVVLLDRLTIPRDLGSDGSRGTAETEFVDSWIDITPSGRIGTTGNCDCRWIGDGNERV